MEAFFFKVRLLKFIFYFWQGSLNLKAISLLPSSPKIITKRNSPYPQIPKTPGDPTDQRLLETFAASWRSKTVAAYLLCILKRLAATDLDRRPCCDLYKTLPRPLQCLCNYHFFGRGEVPARSQTLWDQG